MADSHTFQAPRGTRDFYPEDLAIRRHIERVWREVSVNHGFEEIEGPMFEHLDLYTVKSGEGIVNELFSFIRAGGETRYALRPEFTPTLARMYAARAGQLPKPTKWFVIPNHFRARPQRGRLREFIQWNIDVIGGSDSVEDQIRTESDVIGCTINILERLGLSPDNVKVRLNDRRLIDGWAINAGIDPDKLQLLMWAQDNIGKLTKEQLQEKFTEGKVSNKDVESYKAFYTKANELGVAGVDATTASKELGISQEAIDTVVALQRNLDSAGYGDWWLFDSGIVRGLAYYTGTVFEVIAEGERAIAGGGRYDKLIELVGGPPTPAVGIAMGDVVLRLVLEDHGLLDEARSYMPRPDVFVIAAKEERDDAATTLIANLRRAGHHVRHTYRSTRNVGKLLGEAGKVPARYAIILGDELAEGNVALKDLDGGEQSTIALADVPGELARRLAACPE